MVVDFFGLFHGGSMYMAELISYVSGQQNLSRIFAVALASLAKMSTSWWAIYGTYATAVASTEVDPQNGASEFAMEMRFQGW